MKMRRMTDKLQFCNWFISGFVFTLVVYLNVTKVNFVQTTLILLLYISLQTILLFKIIKACDKRYNFSITIANKIHVCLLANMLPTQQAIIDAKEDLRREYNKKKVKI